MQSRGRERVSIPLSRFLHQWPGIRGLSRAVAHFVGRPALHEIYLRSTLLTTSAEQAVEAIFGDCVGYAQEYEHVQQRIAEQSTNANLRYPDYFAIEEATAYLLYVLVRRMRP